MGIKEYDIRIPKMDYKIISLSVLENGVLAKLNDNDLIFMTVRPFIDSKEITFQKKLGKGITYNEDTQKYEIEINSSDTENLKTNKEYGYDITIYKNGNKPRQKVVGNFTATTKYTLNEVV